MPDAETVPADASQSSSWLVLIADNSVTMRKSLAKAIRAYDTSIEIVEAMTGREALEVLVARAPNLAFINLQLPEISGAEAIAWASRRNIRPLTILMSNQVLPKWVEVSTELGAYEFWRKRFDPEHLMQLLAAYRVMQTPMKLLLVDENPTAHDVIARMLGNCRFTLEIDDSDNGTHAIGLMRSTRYDVALIELDLLVGDERLRDCLPGARPVPVDQAHPDDQGHRQEHADCRSVRPSLVSEKALLRARRRLRAA